MRTRWWSLALVVPLALAGCGDDSGDDAAPEATSGSTTATTAPAPTTTAGSTTTTAGSTTTLAAGTTAPPTSTGGGGAAAGPLACGSSTPAGTPLAYDLSEFEVAGPTDVAAGPVGLALTNSGQANHQLTIIKGDAYESLPVNANGTVITAQLAAGTLVAATDRFPGGGTCDVSVDLDPGAYVLVCNIEFQNGPQVVSHAGRGMHTVLTVT